MKSDGSESGAARTSRGLEFWPTLLARNSETVETIVLLDIALKTARILMMFRPKATPQSRHNISCVRDGHTL